jgi:GDPmannose 4,6-dehydratase
MWRMLQADQPDDYVLATGVGATVEQFAEVAFKQAGLDWHDHIEIDPAYFRPAEVDYLLGDPTKAEKALGWKAETHWDDLSRLMVDADVRALENQLAGRLLRADR